ncbi:ribonuclease H-like protein [Nemania sp. FL0916]|nr:ribonuclease H-like protein [Nemania sp. FL0916]
MPRGYYLGQGLIPLGEDSSDDDEGPCELPNGRLVCGPHGLVVCGRCCSDYSFMDDVLGEQEDDMDDDEFDAPGPQLGPLLRILEGGDTIDQDLYMEMVRRLTEDNRGGSDGDSDDEMDSDGDHANAAFAPPPPFSGPEKRRGTGLVFPTKFTPPSSTIRPTELFSGVFRFGALMRSVHRDDRRKLLIFTDGACLDNGRPDPKAGWAIVDGPDPAGGPGRTVSARLENKGPFGDPGIQTSNRAELRAVLAALRIRHWTGEGFNTMVIATDSEYVAVGATQWVRTWVQNGWRTAGNKDVKNRDLWEMLLGEAERWHDEGLAIQFWRIPREWNTLADAAAKSAAEKEPLDQWREIHGICI